MVKAKGRPVYGNPTVQKRTVVDPAYSAEINCLLDCCVAVNTARSLAVWIIAKAGEWDEYLALPASDPESETFADDYLVSKMLSKNPRLKVSADPLRAAESVWLSTEDACRSTNEFFDSYEIGTCCAVSPIFSTLLEETRREIVRILGEIHESDLKKVYDCMRFGPGVTSSVNGDETLPSRKYVARIDATPRLVEFVPTFYPCIGQSVPDIRPVLGSKTTFVPKNAKIHRAIAVEPHANIYFQLGVGGLLRDRLRNTGIDLDIQADRNRVRVRSAERALDATIDLSSASDTIACRLVAHLLPIDWYHLLDISRSDSTSFKRKWVRLEKFSSMGNGYTFELETLIFLAACRACGSYDADVFGDDIIVEQANAHKVIAFLKFLGFSVNKEKTFLAGRFFESCGVDICDGKDVRPFFLKRKTYESVTSARIQIANAIRIYANRRNGGCGCDRRFFLAWLRSHERDPLARKTRVPANTSSVFGIIRELDEPDSHPSRHRCWDGWIMTHLGSRTPVSPRTSQFGAYCFALHKGLSRDSQYVLRSSRLDPFGFPSKAIENVRGAIPTLCLSTSFVSEWCGLGPWV